MQKGPYHWVLRGEAPSPLNNSWVKGQKQIAIWEFLKTMIMKTLQIIMTHI